MRTFGKFLASLWQVFGKSEENTGGKKTPDLFKFRMIHERNIHPKLTYLSETIQIRKQTDLIHRSANVVCIVCRSGFHFLRDQDIRIAFLHTVKDRFGD